MAAFQTFLKSLLAIYAIISEYSLFLDRWIYTSPAGPVIERQRLSPSEIKRNRWISVLKTSVAYALLEPVCCWLILVIPMRSPHNVVFGFLFGGFLNIIAVDGSTRLKLDSLEKVKKEHEEQCGGSVAGEDAKAPRSSEQLIPNDRDEEDDNEKLLDTDLMESSTPPSSASRDTTPTPCVTKHKLGRLYQIANYPPIVTASFANAGLLLYCRYLATDESQTWLDNFAFGWTVIVLLSIFTVSVSKYTNRTMHEIMFRPFRPACTVWDAVQILTCLALILTVRAGMRVLLGQSPFTPIAWSEAQSAYIVEGYPVPEGELMNEDGTPWQPKAIWIWLGLASSVCQIVGWSGYWGYRLYIRSRERRRVRIN